MNPETGIRLGSRVRNLALFGVGTYTFAPWRVAVSGFYKKLDFRVVGSFNDKPIVLDDTCYFVPCALKAEAVLVRDLLHSRPARELLSAFVFWDSKRPVTVGLLNRLDLLAVAREAGSDDQLSGFLQAGTAGNQLEFPI